MLKRLEGLEARYNELNDLLIKPEVISDQKKFRELSREHAHLARGVKLLGQYRKALDDLEQTEELMAGDDAELKALAEMEAQELQETIASLEDDIPFFLIPPDPNEGKNVIVEIRAGTGGDESALFAADLFRMYSHYAEDNKIKVDVLNSHDTGLGGYKEIVFSLEGKGAYDHFRYEMGTHRVQRVPETESSGRIHTSAATVAVLVEAEEQDVEILDNDLRVDLFRSSGPGGQSVNTTDSAVRITHLPSGLVVTCQDEKSQHKNKARAMKVLRARLWEQMEMERQQEITSERRSQIGSGDRSGRIRTYNFPENRVTDHRIKLTLHKLDVVMQGQMSELVEALDNDRRKKLLAEMSAAQR